VWVGISFSKQNCSHRHVTVFNLSTTMCSSTNSLGAARRILLTTNTSNTSCRIDSTTVDCSTNAWFTLASFGDFCPSNYAVFWWFCHTLLVILVWWFRSLFQLISDLARHRLRQWLQCCELSIWCPATVVCSFLTHSYNNLLLSLRNTCSVNESATNWLWTLNGSFYLQPAKA